MEMEKPELKLAEENICICLCGSVCMCSPKAHKYTQIFKIEEVQTRKEQEIHSKRKTNFICPLFLIFIVRRIFFDKK